MILSTSLSVFPLIIALAAMQTNPNPNPALHESSLQSPPATKSGFLDNVATITEVLNIENTNITINSRRVQGLESLLKREDGYDCGNKKNNWPGMQRDATITASRDFCHWLQREGKLFEQVNDHFELGLHYWDHIFDIGVVCKGEKCKNYSFPHNNHTDDCINNLVTIIEKCCEKKRNQDACNGKNWFGGKGTFDDAEYTIRRRYKEDYNFEMPPWWSAENRCFNTDLREERQLNQKEAGRPIKEFCDNLHSVSPGESESHRWDHISITARAEAVDKFESCQKGLPDTLDIFPLSEWCKEALHEIIDKRCGTPDKEGLSTGGFMYYACGWWEIRYAD